MDCAVEEVHNTSEAPLPNVQSVKGIGECSVRQQPFLIIDLSAWAVRENFTQIDRYRPVSGGLGRKSSEGTYRDGAISVVFFCLARGAV